MPELLVSREPLPSSPPGEDSGIGAYEFVFACEVSEATALLGRHRHGASPARLGGRDDAVAAFSRLGTHAFLLGTVPGEGVLIPSAGHVRTVLAEWQRAFDGAFLSPGVL